MNFKLKALSCLIAAACLSACGGGGGGSTGGTAPAPNNGGSDPGGQTQKDPGTSPPPPPLPSLMAISSPEVSVVRGKYSIRRDAVPVLPQSEDYDLEVGLDAQRRVVRFTIRNPQSSADCQLSTIVDIFGCTIQNQDATIRSTFALEPDAQPDVAVLIEKETITSKNEFNSESFGDSKTEIKTRYRWTQGQLMEPLSTEWKSTRSSPEEIRDSASGTSEYITARDAKGHLYVVTQTNVKTPIYPVSLSNKVPIKGTISTTGLTPEGWAVTVNKNTLFESISPSYPTTRNQETEQYVYEGEKLVRATYDFIQSGLESGTVSLSQTGTLAVDRWSPGPDYAPLEISTTSKLSSSSSNYESSGKYHIAKTGSRLTEEHTYTSSTSAAGQSASSERHILTLETDQPVYTWNRLGQCARVDRSCPGYYIQGGLLDFAMYLGSDSQLYYRTP